MSHCATILSDMGVLEQVGIAAGVVAAVGLTVTMIGVCVAVTRCSQFFCSFSSDVIHGCMGTDITGLKVQVLILSTSSQYPVL